MTAGDHKPIIQRRFSPITWRILTVNVLALIILAAGFLYLGEYRRILIDAELSILRTHAEIFAAALSESAVTQKSDDHYQLYPQKARQIIKTIIRNTPGRVRLFNIDGGLLADSHTISNGGEEIIIERLPPPMQDKNIMGKLLAVYEDLLSWLPGLENLAPYINPNEQDANAYVEVMSALYGEAAAMARHGNRSSAVLSVAVPVQRYKMVLGALMVTADSKRVDAVLLGVRLDILKIFGLTLAVTILMSFYLAGSIAQPLRRLASTAEHVRRSLSRQYRIPDLAGRRDEIGYLSHALRDMTEALWTRMDAIEKFAADVSHEIKNPLTSLRSAVETASRLKDIEQQRQLMSIIQDDVQRLDRLIGDISDASRLDAELSRAEFEIVDVEKVLSALVEIEETTTENTRPSIHLKFNGEGPFLVNGIESRLIQVFRNLIGNAMTFSPKDGNIGILLERNEKMLAVIVDDDGSGIPEGKEKAIFERFYSERPKGEKFGTHSGLGLSISQQIIKAHGGALTAASRYDPDGVILGARFRVALPAV